MIGSGFAETITSFHTFGSAGRSTKTLLITNQDSS
jgi:hypothetical protein